MKNSIYLGIFCALFFAGCSAYKELMPKPELQPHERGFIEIKNEQADFLLEPKKKYFIKFPRSEQMHFYVVLHSAVKPALRTVWSNNFEEDEDNFRRFKDETAGSDSILVFPNDTTSLYWYWIIDSVKQTTGLSLSYRYVPRWRYTFENKYLEYKSILSENIQNRTVYQSIDKEHAFENFSFAEVRAAVAGSNGKIKNMHDELLALKNIFPPDIAAKKDTAYEQYLALKTATENEIDFQTKYQEILSMFFAEKETQGNFTAFLDKSPGFITFLEQRSRYTAGIVEKAIQVFAERLSECVPFYDQQLKNKTDLLPFQPAPEFDPAVQLYKACGKEIPDDLDNLIVFTRRLNEEIIGFRTAQEKYSALQSLIVKKVRWPDNNYYHGICAKIAEALSAVPQSATRLNLKYRDYPTVTALRREIESLTKDLYAMQTIYQAVDGLVVQINALKDQRDYRGIIRLLKENSTYDFLPSQYPDLDELSFAAQTAKIKELLESRRWYAAEDKMVELTEDKEFVNLTAVTPKKNKVLSEFERQLFSDVKQASALKVDQFAKESELVITNIPALYEDSSFQPVYSITFSTAGPARVKAKRKEIEEYLNEIKYLRLPERAIKGIYNELIQDISDRGVEKARAILEHGKMYKGNDRQIKNLIAECDPAVPKPLTKAKETRKILVLPTTSNERGSNTYLFRILLQIQSDAEFPTFDVNIRIPQEIALRAGEDKWYSGISINKKPVKNEGNVKITAPTAANNYEFQISPLQLEKKGTNILEVRFERQGLKVFEISAMAQKPIMKKN